MTPQRRTTLCREGLLYSLILAMVFGGAMLREVNLLLMLAGLLLGPLLMSWRVAIVALRGLEVERNVPQGICAGDLLVGTVRLRNTRRRLASRAIVVEEQIQREGARHEEMPIRLGILFPYVAPGESRDGSYRGRLPRRGRYRLGPLRLSTRFPFGLLCRTLTLGQTQTLIVFPRLGRLTQQWARRHRESLAGAHRRERRPGPEGDFYGVREWRAGDSRRWIHWRSSARSGKLVVRQFEQPRNRDIAILLDLWQPANPEQDHLDNVELAVSFTATLVTDLCRRGECNLRLGLSGPSPQSISGPASPALLQETMQCLALAQPEHRDHLAELLRDGLSEIQPGTEVVLVSTRSLDLDDAARLTGIGPDPARRALLRRTRCIDASSDELNQYFQAE